MVEKNENIEFDFRKNTQEKIQKTMTKIEYSSYKKLAFLAISIGVFTSLGIFTEHSIHNTLEARNTIQQKSIDNINAQIASVSNEDYQKTIQYYQKIVTMYDEKSKFITVESVKYNLQTRTFDSKIEDYYINKLHDTIYKHKEDTIEKINTLQSYHNKILSKIELNFKEAKFFIDSVENAKNDVYYQNTEVEKCFDLILIAKKEITEYYIKKNIYDTIEKLDKNIKDSFNTANSIKSTNSSDINNINNVNTKPKM